MGFELVGDNWDRETFADYLKGVNVSWADSVTVHHTSTPNLEQRPNGWTAQHMRNLESFYGDELGWSAGPHLFTDEDQIWGLSSLYRRGVHAVSFNAKSIGIETLGDYDTEDPKSGRGLACFKMTAFAVATILKRMGKPANNDTVHFHRDDPRTSKTCPGKLVDKAWFLGLVKEAMGEEPEEPEQPDHPESGELEERVRILEQRLDQLVEAVSTI